MKRHKFLANMFFPAMKRYNWYNFVRFLAFCVILICTTEENLKFIFLSMCVKNFNITKITITNINK